MINRDQHLKYLTKGISGLHKGFTSLDASQPWICYWILHSLDLLKVDLGQYQAEATERIKYCQHENGGFGGGDGQLAHLATTYAAVAALVTLGPQSVRTVDKAKMTQFINSLRQQDGSYIMHLGGEVDVRGSYCAVAVAHMLKLDINTENVANFVVQYQTYEGGFGGCPGAEAHGGYTFCAVACLRILNKLDLVDLRKLKRWLIQRQMDPEGGFQGRTGKLVDACYTFWQGALFPILEVDCNWNEVCGWVTSCAQKETGGFTDRIGGCF